MNDVEFQDWVERSNLGLLSQEQERDFESLLASDAALRSRWRAEQELNTLLRNLPPVPLNPRFADSVLRAVAQEPSHRPHGRTWLLVDALRQLRGAWQFALGCAVIGISLAGFQMARQQQLARMAETVATVSQIASVPSVSALADFDAIMNLPESPVKEPDKLLTELEDSGSKD